MKTLYYTVEKELQDIDGIEETTGYKFVRLYDIVNNKPLLIAEITGDNENSNLDEINLFIEETMMEESFETYLDKKETYIFELI